eukprot:Phypoly_transcript_07719.p1 GENE.Phypoly_transcript_07719~~Phypoly_transcript_07719.p1  ORF type:complete len:420 (+),score=17.82 Phypoly_transcript_07719:16-1275(+)
MGNASLMEPLIHENENEDEQNEGTRRGKKSFALFHRVHLSYRVVVSILCVGAVVGSVIQFVGLPLWLISFDGGPGLPGYFALWICYSTFTLVFGLGAIFLVQTGKVAPEMRQWRWHKYIIIISVLSALNGTLAVYSNFLSRVSGPLNAILGNVELVCTIIFSKFMLSKVFNKTQIFGGIMVAAGIIISLIPSFAQIGAKNATWWWPLISLLSYVPFALMNVVQEKMQDCYRLETESRQKRYSIIYLQAFVSLYELICYTLIFWVDLIPGFGLSENMNDFFTTFQFDWKCLWGLSSAEQVAPRCAFAGGLGAVFMVGFMLSYAANAGLTMYASANLLGLVNAVPPIISAMFWFVFPSVNAWAGGSPLTCKDLMYALIALPIIVSGILIFRAFEREDKGPSDEELLGLVDQEENESVELCW